MARHGTPSQRRAKLIVRAAIGRARRDDAVVDYTPRVPNTAFYIEIPLTDGRVQPVAFPGVRSP
jgi:hypothetical protein